MLDEEKKYLPGDNNQLAFGDITIVRNAQWRKCNDHIIWPSSWSVSAQSSMFREANPIASGTTNPAVWREGRLLAATIELQVLKQIVGKWFKIRTSSDLFHERFLNFTVLNGKSTQYSTISSSSYTVSQKLPFLKNLFLYQVSFED